jgi:uncharacterized protein YcfL
MKKLFTVIVLLWSSFALAQSAASKVEFAGTSDAIKVNKIQVKQGALMQVQAEMYNDLRKPMTVYYRTRWLDEGGFQVWEDEAWKPMVFQAFTTQRIQMTAPTPKARDFKIQLSTEDATRAPRQMLNQ